MESRELFLTSYHFFREVMCSKTYTAEQKRNCYANLVEDYLRCDVTDNDIITMTALTAEFDRRLVLEAMPELCLSGESK